MANYHIRMVPFGDFYSHWYEPKSARQLLRVLPLRAPDTDPADLMIVSNPLGMSIGMIASRVITAAQDLNVQNT